MDLATMKTAISTPIQLVGELVQLIKSNTVDYYKTTSLTEATKLSRVEPIVVVSRDLANYEYTQEILQTLLNLFAGYYLQAVALTARIGNVRIVKILDRLNPDRDSSGFFASMESTQNHRFMMSDQYKYRLPRVSMEGRILDTMSKGNDLDDYLEAETKANNPDRSHVAYDRELQKNFINEASNLAVGKMLIVTVHVDDKEMQIPVNIRLAPALLGEGATEHLMTVKKEDNTMVERYHAWRAGRISFIRDLVLCQDLIDEHRKALMKDEEGVFSEIMRRVNNAKKYGLLTQNPSLASASNLFVISEELAKNVEHKLGGKLSNARIRDKMFENTYAMIIAVVDREWERITFYHRGIAASTNVSIKDIKAANKNKGPDIADIVGSLIKGQSPSF